METSKFLVIQEEAKPEFTKFIGTNKVGYHVKKMTDNTIPMHFV